MPTHEQTAAFLRDFRRLTKERRALFLEALGEFIEDLIAIESGRAYRFRPNLRVKKIRAEPGLFEMTWDPDGRATFSWGDPVREGKKHVIWERCGRHNILP